MDIGVTFIKQYARYLIALTFATKLQSILSDPPCPPGSTLSYIKPLAMTQASALLISSGQTATLSPLLGIPTYPVNSWVTSDCLVESINQDYFIIFVGRILSYPVRGQNTQTFQSSKTKYYDNLQFL